MIRIGHGYDVHRFAEGRKLILGGVEIPCNDGLLGHSDADALCHALTDALFGAVCLPDIGRHFPDSDPKYEGANSLELLRLGYEEVLSTGFVLLNADCTIIAERPKLAPFISDMRAAIAKALSTDISNINIKATTEEGLGIGGKGIGAHAVVLLEKKLNSEVCL